MKNLHLQTVLFVSFLVPSLIFANPIDSNDQQKIVNHFNAYVDEGKIPNISILIKQDNK